MPGVSVTTVTRTGPGASDTATSAYLFVAGQAERGSVTSPILLAGYADYEAKFGNRVSYSHLADTVRTFFEEGGSRCYVVRTVGADATLGAATIVDGSDEDTLVATAANPGAWSGNLDLVVSNNGTRIRVVYNDEAKAEFNGATIEALIEASTGNDWVVLTSAGSISANPLPAVGTYTLTAGTDDRASITADDYIASLDAFDITLGDGAVAIPGIGETVHDGLVAHAVATRRVALLDHSETASVEDLTLTAMNLDTEYAGLFAPWVQISTTTGTRYIPPVGYVAAARARAHLTNGAYRVPAGEISTARYLVGLKYDYNRATGDELDAGKVSVIRFINRSIRLYGWRSLSEDTANYALLNNRDFLNRLVVESERRLEQYVFSTVDARGHLLSSISGTITGIVEPYRQAGGLFEKYDANGDLIDPGYLVETGNTVNTLDNLANNEVKAKLSVRISPTAALISVTIVKVGLLAGL